MTTHIQYTEADLIQDTKQIAEYIKTNLPHVDSLYGVPRGGRIPAAMVSAMTGFPIVIDPTRTTAIIDDIVDSGATRHGWRHLPFLSLHCANKAKFLPTYSPSKTRTDTWVHYFWEGAPETAGADIITRMIELIGDDPNRSGVVETPQRVLRSWKELFSGYGQDPTTILKAGFQEGQGNGLDGIIYLRDIEFFSMCEHHILPFYGKAHVGYIPRDGKVVGISKLARLVDCFARRLQIQERIANQVVDALMDFGVMGAICVIEARHLCIACRGVGKQHSIMGCSAIRGVFMDKPAARAEAISLLMRENGK